MKTIHLLDNSLIDKIAAGEVVERPASVVKELLENSVDAGASVLEVEIKDGGTSYIRITDNGCGIPADELRTAFMRHATSKLEKFEDLEDIATLGFRGEALSSIASVAEVEMVTSCSDGGEGTRIVLSGGRVVEEKPSAARRGTTITVKDLFFNTPARRKFLKKPSAESGYVSETVNRIALGHPHISVKYINNGNVMLHTSGSGSLKEAVLSIYGRQQAASMLEARLSRGGYTLDGLVCKPSLSRANRSYESFFINGRYVRSSVVSGAVEEAYKGRLMNGRFPVFMLNMTVPANTVDVNVHPTKLEVRFSDESFIYSLVYDTAAKALGEAELIPQTEWGHASSEPVREDREPERVIDPGKIDEGRLRFAEDLSSEGSKHGTAFADIVNRLYGGKTDEAKEERSDSDKSANTDMTKTAESAAAYAPNTAKQAELPMDTAEDNEKNTASSDERKPFFTHYKIIGQVFNTYWIVEQDDKMYLIDQHAAHERVLYERLVKRVNEGDSVSQLLLQPIALSLTESEAAIVEENNSLLSEFGYDIEQLGPGAYALRAVPFVFDSPAGAPFFLDIIDVLKDKTLKSIYDTKPDALAAMSCRAAVKGGNRLSLTEAKALIEQMLELENPFNCPHGRPTIIEMSKYELEKKFKRVL